LLQQDDREALRRHVEQGAWQNYLTVLHRACKNVEAEQLLGLFI
jgi:hypothetical protein